MPKIKVKFRGLIEKEVHRNKLAIVNEQYYRHLINKFQIGEEVWVTIENKRSHRSLPQNSLYWLYLTCLAEHTGHTTEEMHEYCKGKYLRKRAITVRGDFCAIPGSTAKLSKGEFVEYIMQIQALAAELSIELPDPKDLDIVHDL